jgi:hypothetical protein
MIWKLSEAAYITLLYSFYSFKNPYIFHLTKKYGFPRTAMIAGENRCGNCNIVLQKIPRTCSRQERIGFRSSSGRSAFRE